MCSAIVPMKTKKFNPLIHATRKRLYVGAMPWYRSLPLISQTCNLMRRLSFYNSGGWVIVASMPPNSANRSPSGRMWIRNRPLHECFSWLSGARVCTSLVDKKKNSPSVLLLSALNSLHYKVSHALTKNWHTHTHMSSNTYNESWNQACFSYTTVANKHKF